MNKHLAIALIIFASSIFDFAQSQAPAAQSVQYAGGLADLFASLEKGKTSWLGNSQFSCKAQVWRLDNKTSEDKIKEFLQLVQETQSKIPNKSLPVVLDQADKFSTTSDRILGATSTESWSVWILNDTKRFMVRSDPGLLKAMKSQIGSQESKINSIQQWLFTDKTVYYYGDGANVLQVTPLDPFTQAYPLRIDLISLILGLKGSVNDFIGSLKMSGSESGKLTFEMGDNNSLLSVIESDKNIGIQSIVLKSPGTISSRYFLNNAIGLVDSFIVPLTVVEVTEKQSKTVIKLFTFTALEFGKVTSDMMALHVPKTSSVADELIPAPAKVEQK